MSDTQLGRLQAAQQLTAEYASYAQRRSGLGNVLGGIAGLAAYFVGLLYGPGTLTAAITIVATLAWLIGKELLRRQIYQAFGMAREPWPKPARRLQIGLTVFLALVAVGVLVGVLWNGYAANPGFWPYMLFVALTPLIAWRFLRTESEFIVGVFLLCACAVTSAGGAYDLANFGLLFIAVPIAAIALIVLGIREHRQFLVLREQLRAIQGQSRDD